MGDNPPRKEGKSVKGLRCPICGKDSVPGFRPFCSQRCRSVDLNRWLAGVYRVETDEAPEATERPSPVSPDD